MWLPRWVKRIIEAVQEESGTIKQSLAEQERAIKDAGQAAEEKQREVGATIAASIKAASDAATNYEKPQRDREHSLQWGMFLVTLTGTLFAAAAAAGAWYYAHIAAKQLCTMNAMLGEAQQQTQKAALAITQSKDLFVRDTRPYLAQTIRSTSSPQILTNNPDTPGQAQIAWKWSMTNYGKSPANNILLHQEMSVNGGPFFSSFGANGKRGAKGYDVGAAMPPSGESFDTIFSPPMDPRDAVIVSKDGLSIRVHIQYTDLDGNRYESALCLQYSSTFAIAYCKKDNYIH